MLGLNKISALLVVAVVLVFFAGVYVVLNPLTFPSTTAAIVTLNGTVEEVISDCPPSTSRNQTCSFFDVIVLRAVNGSTFLLHNLPSPTRQWIGKAVSVTGRLVMPSTSHLAFIQGDLYVITIAVRAS